MIIFCYLFLWRHRDVGPMLLLHQYKSGIVLVKAVQNLIGKAKISMKRVRRKTGNYLFFTTVYQHPQFHIYDWAVDRIDLKPLFFSASSTYRCLPAAIMVADTQRCCTAAAGTERRLRWACQTATELRVFPYEFWKINNEDYFTFSFPM